MNNADQEFSLLIYVYYFIRTQIDFAQYRSAVPSCKVTLVVAKKNSEDTVCERGRKLVIHFKE